MSQEVTVYNPRKFERDRARVNNGFWPKIRRVARRIPFMGELLAAYYATLDPKTPLQVKAVLMGALAYFVLPVDVIPDFIAGFGFTDDAAVLYAAIRSVAGSIRDEHRQRAKQMLDKALAD
ncbi:YkvA family protein [Dongia sedimenti]|uniref:YkvA family protein n=1 Tax=Dongia sedimenti TaxID=3064282 RepID=A0ABU0YP84_9PROT|nr:YkvA family protein [Rhodospirillaceae bacterium R-7]